MERRENHPVGPMRSEKELWILSILAANPEILSKLRSAPS